MKPTKKSLEIALYSALCLAAGLGPARAQQATGASMTQMQAESLDAGSTHVISYFRGDNGKCRLTLMIAERVDGKISAQWARLQFPIESGETVRFDTGRGASLAFACESAARSMRIEKIDRVAAYPGE